jgi:hypothetical protein
LSCLTFFWFGSKVIRENDADGMAYTGIARHFHGVALMASAVMIWGRPADAAYTSAVSALLTQYES